jgi:hypothetical protein
VTLIFACAASLFHSRRSDQRLLRQSAVTRALVSRCAALHGFVLRGLEPNRKSDPLDRPFSSKFIDKLFALYVFYKQLTIRVEESPSMKANLKLVTPTIEKQTVKQRGSKNPKGRKPNAELRTREHLTPAEVETLIKTMKGNRNGAP